MLQFPLSGPVVALQYSPSAQHLAAAAETEIALWSRDANAVTKHPVGSPHALASPLSTVSHSGEDELSALCALRSLLLFF